LPESEIIFLNRQKFNHFKRLTERRMFLSSGTLKIGNFLFSLYGITNTAQPGKKIIIILLVPKVAQILAK